MTGIELAMHTDGAVSCGARLWRFRGRLQLTVVVKAVFAIVPDGVAAPAGPGEIVAEDRYLGGHPLRSVEAASDLAPYLKRCDVLFAGHAHAPSVPAAAVRLGLSRDGQRLLDKTIHVHGDRGPGGAREPFTRMPIVYERALGRMGAANPVGTDTPNLADPRDPQRPAGFGPIGRYWPVRRHLLGKLDGKAIDAAVAEIPEAMPWEYFQAAPPDQQIEHLRGGEWLVLDGLHPSLARVQTRLAVARGAAHVVLRRPGAPAAEQALDLACDTLAIDGDRQTFSLAWRGRCEVPDGEASLPRLVIVAALEAPGVPVDWARLVAGARPPSAAPPAAAPVVANLMSTAVDGLVPNAPALPFAKDASTASVLSRLPPSPSSPKADRPTGRKRETMALSLDQLPPLPGAALPFAPAEPSGGPKPSVPADVSGAPWSVVPARPVSRPAEEPVTAVMAPLEPHELFTPATDDGGHPPVVPALRSEPPPPLIAPLSPPPDPWARAPAPSAEPEPQKPVQPSPAFERPAAAAVKATFYAKFKK